jgi:hypothetical protein
LNNNYHKNEGSFLSKRNNDFSGTTDVLDYLENEETIGYKINIEYKSDNVDVNKIAELESMNEKLQS